MATHENPTRELVDALDQINLVLADLTAHTVSDLIPLRVRVMRPLITHLSALDRYSAELRLGSDSEKALAKKIEAEVSSLRKLVNSHIAHWTPAAIANDLPSYKNASDNLQRSMRRVAAL
jgi:hypothetical protein